MPDDHPPLTAVAAALDTHWSPPDEVIVTPSPSALEHAAVVLRALNTDPVREWAADAGRNMRCRYRPALPCNITDGALVHPECLLAALAHYPKNSE